MKQILAVIVFLASSHVAADSWEGSTVKVPQGTLMCEYFAIENARVLDKVGGAESLGSTLEKSSCLYAPKELMAMVTSESADADGVGLAEVQIGRTTIWVAKDEVECCFE